jgi:hypothetical protein
MYVCTQYDYVHVYMYVCMYVIEGTEVPKLSVTNNALYVQVDITALYGVGQETCY